MRRVALALSARRCCLPRVGSSLNKRVGVFLDAELHRAAKVDVRKVRWSDAAQPLVLDPGSLTFQPFDDLMHPARVPGQHDVRQQCVGARDRQHLVAPSAALWRNLAAVDRALKLMHRFAPVQ